MTRSNQNLNQIYLEGSFSWNIGHLLSFLHTLGSYDTSYWTFEMLEKIFKT